MKSSSIISNNIYVKNASSFLVDWVYSNLVVTNPKYEKLMRLGKQDQISRFHIPSKMALFVENGFDFLIPFGCLRPVWKYIKNDPMTIRFNECEDISCKNDKITQNLYDYQEEAVQKMIEAKGGILIGSCGCGKTNVGIEIVKRIGKNALWLCHTKDLLTQTIKRIKQLYPNMHIGTITDGKVDMVQDGITVSTIQTLANVDSDIYKDKFGTVLTDECHHVSGSPTLQKYFVKVVTKIAARYKYGITASDKRNDTLTKSMYTTVGCNLDGEFAPVWRIQRSNTKTLTAKHEKVELNTPFSFCFLESDGTFSYNKLIDYLSQNEERNNIICEKIIGFCKENRKQLVLCSRISHCETIHEKLTEMGAKSVLLVGKVNAKKREEILTEKTEWNVIVATISLAKEGLDVTTLDTLHLVSCLGNESDTVQSVGRIERVCERKQEPIVLDYVDINIPYLVNKYKKRVNWLKRRK